MPAVWTSPLTWLVDQLVTDADLNQQLRDNELFLYAGLLSYVSVKDVKATTVAGGGFTAGAWQVRDLAAASLVDVMAIGASVAANQISLPIGTYLTRIQCPCYFVNLNQARLYNVTDAAVLLYGQNGYATAYGYSTIVGKFTLAGTKTLQIEHRCSTTRAADGYGLANSFGGDEIYTQAEFWRVSPAVI